MPTPPHRLRTTLIASALGVSGLVSAGSGHATQQAPATAPSPLGLSCMTCHGRTQRPGAHAIHLGSLSSAQLAAALRAYRSGERAGTIMPRITRPLSDADIEALAAELGGRP